MPWERAEIEAARRRYLGGAAAGGAGSGTSSAGSKGAHAKHGPRQFNMDWDPADDTSPDVNPLYARRLAPALGFGRGYQAGVDMREQRKDSHYLETLVAKRVEEARALAAAAASAAASAAALTAAVAATSGAAPPLPDDAALTAASAARLRAADALIGKSIGVAGAHWSDKALDAMTDRDWRIMREDFDIHVKGGKPLPPLRKWDECPLAAPLRQAVDAMGYTEPTPIQRQAIPMGLAGRDLIGVAETGSGKTAAFLLPLMQYVLAHAAGRAQVADAGPLALVMAPVRELAQQIEAECVKLARFAGIRCVSVVGGTSIQEQGHHLREGVDIVIGTPGRLIDVLEQSYLVLHQCRYVVLDEADRMIDMGFEPQVTAVLDAMCKDDRPPAGGAGAGAAASGSGGGGGGGGNRNAARTTHMFTATRPRQVERLARLYLTNPATVKIGDEDTGKNRRITQEAVFLPGEGRKKAKLQEVLARCPRPVIVFVNIKKQCDVVARDLEHAGFAIGVLHGDKSQEAREDSLAEFKAGRFDILVATDVAGRGLDIPDVAQVINYDMATEIDRYTHRIGRTGRAGKTGAATTFLTDGDAAVLPALKAYLESTGQPVPPELAARATGDRRDSVKYAK